MTDLVSLLNGKAPAEEDLMSAPVIEGWLVKERPLARFGPQVWGWFYGHPTVGEGNYGHSSPVTQLDLSTPPRWARTESRLYRLGDVYAPVEREVRLLAHALKIKGERTEHDDIEDRIAARNDPDGGWPEPELDEVEQMIVNLRRSGCVEREKLDRLWNDYRAERYPPSPEDLARWAQDD